jgi:aminomethyltransferase
MGRFLFHGAEALTFLDRLVTCSVESMKPGQIRYGLVCREDGGVLDDVLVYRLHDAWGMVVNAGNRDKIRRWIEALPGFDRTEFVDQTAHSAMIAVQGPRALALLQSLTKTPLPKWKYYTGQAVELNGTAVYLSRTGYTGEDGFEIIATNNALALWQRIIDGGSQFDLHPCGLGARDTLRLEAAMPLYGHELTENIDPLTAGLSFAVKLDKPDFIGKAALVEINKRTDRPVRVGLKLEVRRIAREGCTLYSGQDRIGEVTSGTFSPTLDESIAMGYVAPTHSAAGAHVEVDVRGKREPASVVSLPFYKRK